MQIAVVARGNILNKNQIKTNERTAATDNNDNVDDVDDDIDDGTERNVKAKRKRHKAKCKTNYNEKRAKMQI